jgi:hypothetical protein
VGEPKAKLRRFAGPFDHPFVAAPINALRTSDWEIPNCLAIRDGVTPALKAARTAFSFPCGKGTAKDFICRLRELSWDTDSFLPRRFCSATTAESNRSSSLSASCCIAFRRSAGKAYRDTDVGTAALATEVEEGLADADAVARLDANENRSGVDDRVPMLNHAAVEIGQQQVKNGLAHRNGLSKL